MFSRHGKGHGIHSPFIFTLVSGVFRNKIDPYVVLTVESIRKKNLSDTRTINVTGSWSRIFKNENKIKESVRHCQIFIVPRKYGVLLAGMAAEFGKPAIIEFGTSLGMSAIYMASGCPEAVVYTMEGCPETALIRMHIPQARHVRAEPDSLRQQRAGGLGGGAAPPQPRAASGAGFTPAQRAGGPGHHTLLALRTRRVGTAMAAGEQSMVGGAAQRPPRGS